MQQAARSDSTGTNRRSPGKFNNFAPSTRRDILCAAIGTAAIASVSGAAVAAPQRRWDTLLAQFEAARTAAKQYYRQTYSAASKRMDDLRGPYPATSCTITARSGQTCTVHVTIGREYPPSAPYDRAREMQREFERWMLRSAALERESWWTVIDDRMDALDTAERDARDALMAEPAPDAAALARKLQLALENEDLWENERAALQADANRIVAMPEGLQ